jgi:uncharacterized membrane protein
MDIVAVLGFLGIFLIGYSLGIKKGYEKKSEGGAGYMMLLGVFFCFLSWLVSNSFL